MQKLLLPPNSLDKKYTILAIFFIYKRCISLVHSKPTIFFKILAIRKRKLFLSHQRCITEKIILTCVKESGSEVAPHELQTLCSTKVMANFWWGMQCLALHMSSASSWAMCMCILRSMFSKHSAASSMKPSWKRCWSKKLSARALRRASGGRAVSWENCNWENSSCNKKNVYSVARNETKGK